MHQFIIQKYFMMCSMYFHHHNYYLQFVSSWLFICLYQIFNVIFMIFKCTNTPKVQKHLKIVLTINVLADSLYPLEVSDYIFNGSQWIWRAASHLTISKIDYQLLPNIQCHLQRPIRKNFTSSLSWLYIYELTCCYWI